MSRDIMKSILYNLGYRKTYIPTENEIMENYESLKLKLENNIEYPYKFQMMMTLLATTQAAILGLNELEIINGEVKVKEVIR